ncbi:MAG TPA: Gfo/Idh/MocA family oxidoreductase [Candidatus Brocadiia bacterium]|nr:Gfo/Idh/MocA family oxidoreductase [Candidatus Brocadiia bacterium]
MKSGRHSSRQAGMSRRQFLGRTAVAAAGLAAGCASRETITVVQPHVLGGAGKTPPSERLNVASIGGGGKAAGDITSFSNEKCNIVAICDVDWMNAAPMFIAHPKANRYRDFRDMLTKEDKDIDAVIVTIPDHMHAPAAIMAMKMGKHCYCQKPLTHTVHEARLMARVAKENGVATQMGNEGQAAEYIRAVTEYIAAGAIGKVREVHNWCDRPRGGCPWPQAVERPKEEMKLPAGLAWDLFLGVAPERPYHAAYHPFRWRGWYDFGTGALGDIGCHTFHPIFKIMNLGHPTSVEPFTTELHAETYPLVSMIRYEYPARSENYPATTLTWYDGMLVPPRPPELEKDRSLGSGGTLYVGDGGKILDSRIIPETKHREFPKPAETIPRSIGHFKEFIEACKGGEPAGANFDFAALVTESVLLGNVALKVQRKIEWDAENMKITNVPEANQFLTKEYRKGWEDIVVA